MEKKPSEMVCPFGFSAPPDVETRCTEWCMFYDEKYGCIIRLLAFKIAELVDVLKEKSKQ